MIIFWENIPRQVRQYGLSALGPVAKVDAPPSRVAGVFLFMRARWGVTKYGKTVVQRERGLLDTGHRGVPVWAPGAGRADTGGPAGGV